MSQSIPDNDTICRGLHVQAFESDGYSQDVSHAMDVPPLEEANIFKKVADVPSFAAPRAVDAVPFELNCDVSNDIAMFGFTGYGQDPSDDVDLLPLLDFSLVPGKFEVPPRSEGESIDAVLIEFRSEVTHDIATCRSHGYSQHPSNDLGLRPLVGSEIAANALDVQFFPDAVPFELNSEVPFDVEKWFLS
ncbi:hypothetical protein V5O48_001860 [Marasmius crinis-equi]|uniref:Uncharacterized protein n=1 Tax=Marasmius crinis-equi TaxID=585013 RepID=A0ABR3FX77_9AGAR